jgi:hypothetical protein
MQVVFIIGSPRSGTTILENILGCHPDVAEWYEPYYVWERHFSCKEDDFWLPRTVSEKTRFAVQEEYRTFGRKSDKPVVMDKSPGHVFNISLIHEIFPNAKWIHIIRDGRDVIFSIKKEWEKRKSMVQKKDFLKLLKTAWGMLKRQPFFRYRLMAVLHELRSTSSLNPLKYLNKSRWEGQVGWGPRFKEWREFLAGHAELEFNAMQWVKALEAIHDQWPLIPDENKMLIRYEELLESPEETLGGVLRFLGLEGGANFFGSIPKVYESNFEKWREFTEEEIAQIRPLLNPLLKELGYLNRTPW